MIIFFDSHKVCSTVILLFSLQLLLDVFVDMMESSERETTLSESTDDSSTDDESNKYVPQSVYIIDVYIIITIK